MANIHHRSKHTRARTTNVPKEGTTRAARQVGAGYNLVAQGQQPRRELAEKELASAHHEENSHRRHVIDSSQVDINNPFLCRRGDQFVNHPKTQVP
jgi:hypothetical protein